MTNSAYLEDMFNITAPQAFALHDSMADALLNRKNTPAIEFLKEIRKFEIRRKTAAESIIDAFRTSGTRMVKGLVGTVQAVAEQAKPTLGPTLFDATKKLAEWGALMNNAADLYLREHPEEAAQIIPGRGFFGTAKQYLMRPEAVLQGAVEAGPMMMEAYLGHLTGTAASRYLG